MSGFATVAAALNADDAALARIAAVHLKIPVAAEDLLIKYARGEGGSDWNPALHPRTGAPPNPGWFAPTGDGSESSSRVRVVDNQQDSRRSDAVQTVDQEWVRLPPGVYIDELGDFLEWLANAMPEDERSIRAEIQRYYYDVGDMTPRCICRFRICQV